MPHAARAHARSGRQPEREARARPNATVQPPALPACLPAYHARMPPAAGRPVRRPLLHRFGLRGCALRRVVARGARRTHVANGRQRHARPRRPDTLDEGDGSIPRPARASRRPEEEEEGKPPEGVSMVRTNDGDSRASCKRSYVAHPPTVAKPVDSGVSPHARSIVHEPWTGSVSVVRLVCVTRLDGDGRRQSRKGGRSPRARGLAPLRPRADRAVFCISVSADRFGGLNSQEWTKWNRWN